MTLQQAYYTIKNISLRSSLIKEIQILNVIISFEIISITYNSFVTSKYCIQVQLE